MAHASLETDRSAHGGYGEGEEEPGATISRHSVAGRTFIVLATAIPARPRWASSLTRAEVAVLTLLGQGMRTAEIAAVRGSSVSTVVKQIGALTQKTRSRDRAELIAFGRRHWSERSLGGAPTPLGARAALEAAGTGGEGEPLARAEARDLWEAMLDGGCRFVHRVDARGRRWFVLCEGDAASGALSERERAIVALLLARASNKLVGWELRLSPSTVSLQVRGTLRKLGVVDRAGLVEIAAVLRGLSAG
jgi:DNA-binding CsgD family transcriptional regulator